jgi:hypothetical protein
MIAVEADPVSHARGAEPLVPLQQLGLPLVLPDEIGVRESEAANRFARERRVQTRGSSSVTPTGAGKCRRRRLNFSTVLISHYASDLSLLCFPLELL